MDYEAVVESFYRRILKPGDIAIDVGANVGRHTLPLAQAVAPTGRVYAFEPLEDCRQEIYGKLDSEPELKGVVELSPFALADYSGKSQFVVAVDLPSFSGLRKRIYDSPTRLETIEVEVRRLDDLLSKVKQLKFIKVDAEGGEYHVLCGARRSLEKLRPVISFEFGVNSLGEYEVTPADMSDLLFGLEYEIFDVNGCKLSPLQFCESSERQAVWDYFAVPKSVRIF
jgi:FkbM family methyltransferase